MYNVWIENYIKKSEKNLLSDEIVQKIVDNECYKLLAEIKSILENDSLEDKDCFLRIEALVSAFEKSGCRVSFRHDF